MGRLAGQRSDSVRSELRQSRVSWPKGGANFQAVFVWWGRRSCVLLGVRGMQRCRFPAHEMQRLDLDRLLLPPARFDVSRASKQSVTQSLTRVERRKVSCPAGRVTAIRTRNRQACSLWLERRADWHGGWWRWWGAVCLQRQRWSRCDQPEQKCVSERVQRKRFKASPALPCFHPAPHWSPLTRRNSAKPKEAGLSPLTQRQPQDYWPTALLLCFSNKWPPNWCHGVSSCRASSVADFGLLALC